MKIHINYAHGRYLNSQQYCCQTALERGGLDVTKGFRLSDLNPDFINDNQYILSQGRGAGYWLWKPYLILGVLMQMKTDDWLMYTDSGMYFVKNPWDHILANKDCIGEKGIVTFGLCGKNRQFTKRDAFVLMGLDEEKYTDSEQRTASVFVCRKTEFSVEFVRQWLTYATDPRIITDLPNTQGQPNYPEFIDHRHDQSIMSLLSIKHDTCLMEDMTQFGRPNDPYLVHTRNPS